MGYDRNDPWMTCGERDDLCIANDLDPLKVSPDGVIQAAARVDEVEHLFDLQYAADQRAIKRWQAAHPGNDLVWPDRADMVVWLMEEHDKARANGELLKLAEGLARGGYLTPDERNQVFQFIRARAA